MKNFTPILLLCVLILVHVNLFSQSYTLDTANTIENLTRSTAAWGDIDNDGDLDLIVSGITSISTINQPITKLYENVNGHLTELTTSNISGVYRGDIEFTDYNNDGFLDFLISGGIGLSGSHTKLYKNTGLGSFIEDTSAHFNGFENSHIDWGDFDNDGDDDVLINGHIYENTSNGFTLLPTTFASLSAWVDYDNDGDLDVLSGSDTYSYLYENVNDSAWVATGISFKGCGYVGFDWGDYDQDGDLDLVISGMSSGSSSFDNTFVYKNNGNNSFSVVASNLPAITFGDVSWADMDNDGDLDILLIGSNTTSVYLNGVGNTFQLDISANFQGLGNGNITPADIDNDGDLDVLICGGSNNGESKIYRNTITTPNTSPSVPQTLSHFFSEQWAVLNWSKSNDNQSQTSSLTYNIRAGFTSNAIDMAAPLSDLSTGYRQVVQMGNQGLDSLAYIDILNNFYSGDTIYWSVQAIDGGYKASSFSIEDTLIVPFTILSSADDTINQTQSTQINVYNNFNGPDSLLTIQWSPSTGLNNDSIFNPIASPLTSTMYYVTITTPLGVSSTDSIHIEVTHDQYLKTVAFPSGFLYQSSVWGDYNNDGYLDILVISNASLSLYKNNADKTFTKQTSFTSPQTTETRARFADLNNDGLLDIIYTGNNTTSVYLNDTGFTFSSIQNLNLPDLSYSNMDIGDYDNDGDLDIIIGGESSNGEICKLFKNTLPDSFGFIEVPGTPFYGFSSGSVDFGDYDKDGDLDLIMIGRLGTSYRISIYRNDGNDSYVNIGQVNGLNGFAYGSIEWVDYNSDGFLDIFVTGSKSGAPTTELFQNISGETFVKVNNTGIYNFKYSSFDWGDYNNDGLSDLILHGNGYSFTSNTFLYQNNGNGTFTKTAELSTSNGDYSTLHYYNAVSFGDYDNDGDLEILFSGRQTEIYENYNILKNSNPLSPVNLSIGTQNTSAVLKWDMASDSISQSEALTYNALYKKSGASNWSTPIESDTITGFRRVNSPGNAESNAFIRLNDSLFNIGDTVVWKVQTIDNGLLASSFSPQQSAIIPFGVTIVGNNTINQSETTPLSFLTNYKGADSLMTFSWSPSHLLDDANIGNPLVFPTVTTTFYLTATAPGGLVATDSFVVNVTDFPFITKHEFPIVWAAIPEFLDYDKDGDLDLLSGPTIYRNDGNQKWSVDTNINLIGEHQTTSVSDFDNDNDIDIFRAIYSSYSVMTYAPIKYYSNTIQDSIGFNAVNYLDTAAWQEAIISLIDYDKDGDRDVLYQGGQYIGAFMGWRTSQAMYQNQLPITNSLSVDSSIYMPDLYFSRFFVGDLDADGDEDYIFTSLSAMTQNYVTMVAYNTMPDSIGFVIDTVGVFSQNGIRKMDFGDFDNDGDYDLIIGGDIFQIFENTLPDSIGFVPYATPNTTSIVSDVKWFDYNNDGMLDYITTGYYNNTDYNKVYKNIGTGFIEDTTIQLPIVMDGALAIGDYDGDQDLDVAISGRFKVNSSWVSKNVILMNCVLSPNTKPSIPQNVSCYVDQGRLYANWDPAYDYQTSNSSISYNVAVKHKDSTIFIVSPSADINSGTRDISRIGNNFLDTSFYVDITAYNIGDTLEFQVQSIDNGLQASSFTSAIPIVNCVGGSTSYTNMKYCDGDSALWEGNYYSSPGIYSVSHATSLGCDSTLILQLRMDSLPNIMISNTLPDTIKLHDSPYPIPSVTPVGGVLSGNSINGLMIEPSLGNIGLNYIYYTYTDSTTGCSNMDSLMIFILDDTGIEYNNSPAITVDLYPNPSKSEIFIKISQRPKQYLELQISNSSGQLLRSVKEPSELLYKVNVDGLNKGLYFIKVLDAEGYIASKKFILI